MDDDSVLKLCPACNIKVEYEEGEEQSFCPECGRTHSLAIEAVAFDKKSSLNNKIKLILKIFGYSLVAIIFIIGFVISPDRVGTKFIETAKGMSILAIPGAILVGVMNWRSSKKKKQSSTENIDKQESEDTKKPQSVVITADGKVIRKFKGD